jgi:hypothetical protein
MLTVHHGNLYSGIRLPKQLMAKLSAGFWIPSSALPRLWVRPGGSTFVNFIITIIIIINLT